MPPKKSNRKWIVCELGTHAKFFKTLQSATRHFQRIVNKYRHVHSDDESLPKTQVPSEVAEQIFVAEVWYQMGSDGRVVAISIGGDAVNIGDFDEQERSGLGSL